MFFYIPDDQDSQKLLMFIKGTNIPYQTYKYSDYYVPDMVQEIARSDSFVFCSTLMADALKQAGHPRIYTEGTAVSEYVNLLKDHYVNAEGRFVSVQDLKNTPESELPDIAFYRSDKSDKVLAGGLFERTELKQALTYTALGGTDIIFTAQPKQITHEYRLFVNTKPRKILTGSLYKKQGRNTQQRIEPKRFQDFISNLTLPDIPYVVVDVCLLGDDTIKVVELNPINCAGSYCCDMLEVLKDLYTNVTL